MKEKKFEKGKIESKGHIQELIILNDCNLIFLQL